MPPALRTLNYCNMIIEPYLLHIVRTDEHRQEEKHTRLISLGKLVYQF